MLSLTEMLVLLEQNEYSLGNRSRDLFLLPFSPGLENLVRLASLPFDHGTIVLYLL